MSNSKLDAAKAARYWGCEVADLDNNIHTLGITIMCEIEYGEKFKLLLTPLSSITDEHAIEVAKVLYKDEFPVSAWTYNDKQKPDWVVLDNEDDYDYTLIFSPDELIEAFLPNNQHLAYSRAIDLLRSLGYDCDNAISEGWAVDRLAFVK